MLDYQFHDGLLLHSVASCLAGTVATSEPSIKLRLRKLTRVDCSRLLACGRTSVTAYGCCSSTNIGDALTKLIPISQSGNATFLEVLKTSLHEEGPRFLFKGWTPAFIRLGPNTVLLFVFFEVSIITSALPLWSMTDVF